jgi:hypothetical protein
MNTTASDPPALGKKQIASVTSLPSEILVQIFEGVPDSYNERCKAFSAMSSVNRQFQSIATSLLYRNFQDCCAKHLQLFGRTVLSDKSHAELVKHYEGRRAGLIFNISKEECPAVWNTFVLEQALEEAVAERFPGLSAPMTRASFSYALACLLPNLQRLDVTNGGNALLQHLSGLNSQAIAPFQQLHTLSIAIEPDRAFRMHDISLLFMLPSLRAFFVDMAALSDDEEAQADESTDTSWRCSSRSSTIQELTLERCGLPATWVAMMIRSCRALRHFHHEHYYWDNNANYYPHIVQALMVHQDTLSDVRLIELNGCKLDSARLSDPSTPVSFERFTSLTHLDTPLFAFSTRTHHYPIEKLLPNSLHILTVNLRSAREGFSDDFFLLLAEAIPTHLVRLKSVEIICRIEDYWEEGFLPLHFCHLRRMFSSYGVELVYFLEFVQCEFKAGKYQF